MKEYFLKFANKEEAIAVIAANEPDLFWNDNGEYKIKGSHTYAMCVVGNVYHATGNMLEDGTPEMVLVAGYHVNLNLNGRDFPAYLVPFEVLPITPSCTFGG